MKNIIEEIKKELLKIDNEGFTRAVKNNDLELMKKLSHKLDNIYGALRIYSLLIQDSQARNIFDFDTIEELKKEYKEVFDLYALTNEGHYFINAKINEEIQGIISDDEELASQVFDDIIL